jgi:histidine triad (HIT) family protein
MELTPELKQQLEEQKKQCIFCKIISGEFEGSIAYQDEEIIALLDIRPSVKGHLLVMPKEHYPIMPLIPPETFKHLFGMLPQIIGMQKKAMIMTGADVFIANGGIAGQQAPHFLYHVLGRDNQDGRMQYQFLPKKTDETKKQEAMKMLKHNLPLMMANHFRKHPARWHKGEGTLPSHLKGREIIYQDEKCAVVTPETPQNTGHLELYPKEAEEYEELSYESSAHIFFVASFTATALFEGLKAQGTNIILRTGNSDHQGPAKIHIIARYEDDSLDLIPPPGQPSNTKEILSSYSDHSYKLKKPEEQEHTIPEKKGLEEVQQAIKKAKK